MSCAKMSLNFPLDDDVPLLDDVGGDEDLLLVQAGRWSNLNTNTNIETELFERAVNEEVNGTRDGRRIAFQDGGAFSRRDEGEMNVPEEEDDDQMLTCVDDVTETENSAREKRFFFVRWICRRTCTMFWLALFGHLLFVAITVILYFTGYKILPFILDDIPIFNLHDVMYQRDLAWIQREQTHRVFLFQSQYPSKRKRRSTRGEEDIYPPIDHKYIRSTRMHLLYEVQQNENVFTPRRLDAIRKFESKIVEEFHKGGPRASPAHYACGVDSVSSILEPDTAHLLPNVTDDIWHTGPFIGRDGTIDNVTGAVVSSYARSFMKLCWTYSFRNITVWSVDDVNPELVKQERAILKPVGISLFYWNLRALSEEVYRQAILDTFFFIGSTLFIFFFMWIQTSSFLITSLGTASILTSFIGANLIYNCIIGYKYLGLFNILALFVVLGIGADDIFVFYDTWKSLQHVDDMEARMALTFKRAGAAMFTTSLTTMSAFFVSSFSQILPISSFGTFAGLTVFVNYVSVIIFFPTVVAVHHRYFETFCSRRDSQVTRTSAGGAASNRVFRAVSTFFKDRYYVWVTKKVSKWLITTVFVVLVAGMVYSSSNIRLDQKQSIKAFKDKNMLETAMKKTAFNYKLGAEDKMVTVYIVWGLGPRDMSKCKRLEYTQWHPCSGQAVYDEDFNIEKPENQLAVLNLCRNLTQLGTPLREDLILQSGGNGTNRIVCFMEYFDLFLRTVSKMLNHVPFVHVDLKVPLRVEDIEPVIPILEPLVGLKLNVSAMRNPVQTIMWLFIEKNATQLKQFVGFKQTQNVIAFQNGTPVYDQQLVYAAVRVPLTEQVIRLKVNEGLRLQKEWEKYTVNAMKNMPTGVDKAWQVAGNWFLARQKKNMMYRALTGIALSLCLAFVVLLATTRNLILAFLAEITLAGTVVCVVGILPIGGWDFGALESINMCFVAGLAVDYIVHVVEAYSMSNYNTRKERTKDALGRIGVSVLSGAVTTLGASFFMFFARILFFMQFGTFIFCTVGFSLLFALIFFPAVLDTLGPSGDVGSFRWIFHKISRKRGRL